MPVLIAMFLVPFLIFVGWRWRLKRDVSTRIAAIKAAGFPTSGAKLNSYYPSVPDSENGALVMTQALAMLRYYDDVRSNEVAKFRMPRPSELLTAEQRELLTGHVEMNHSAIAKARESLALPKSRYPIDMTLGFGALLPHLHPLRELGSACAFKGILAADSDRQNEAIESVVTLLGISRTLKDEPILISELVRFRIIRMSKDVLEWSLNADGLNEEESKTLNQALKDTERPDGVFRAMIGERAVAIPLFRMNFTQFDEFADNPGLDSSSLDERLDYAMITIAMRATGFLDRDLKFYLSVMETNILLASKEPPASLAITNVQNYVFDEAVRRRYILSAMILPAVSKAFVRKAESLAEMSLARTAVAIEKFRHLKRRLPANLQELSPEFLPELPVDPFDGQTLRYKPSSVGFVIYSVGEDANDDGGREKPSHVKSTDKTTYDITFTVER